MTDRSRTSNHWYFDHNEDDIRGWPIFDTKGAQIGKVENLLADTHTGFVTAVVATGGRELDAHDLEIKDNRLVVIDRHGGPPPVHLAKPPAVKPPVATAAQPKPAPASATPTPAATPTTPRPTAQPIAASDEFVIQLVDEELEIGKRVYEAGGVHLEAHIISEPIAKDVRLREERVTVSRNKLDRALDTNDADKLFHDEEFEMTAIAETPVVNKYAHVVEEIVIKKDLLAHDEVVRDRVRRMEAEITELRAGGAKHGGRR
jgi:stress response protein YsnF